MNEHMGTLAAIRFVKFQAACRIVEEWREAGLLKGYRVSVLDLWLSYVRYFGDHEAMLEITFDMDLDYFNLETLSQKRREAQKKGFEDIDIGSDALAASSAFEVKEGEE